MERIGALPQDIRNKNDAEILRCLAGMKVFTVQDIADITGISRLTITRAIERFMESGLVIARGKGTSTRLGGKKPLEYSLNPDRYMISVAPSEGSTTCTLMSFDGNQIAVKKFGFLAEIEYPEYIELSAEAVTDLIRENHVSPDAFYGVILCQGGVINHRDGYIQVSSIPHWDGRLNVVEDIKKKLPFETNVEIENVSKVCSSMLRFDKDLQNAYAAVFYADYGVSITLMNDGRIPETANHVNGELGHMCLDADDPEECVCGSRGCFEVMISQKRIFRLVEELEPEQKEDLLKDYDGKTDIRAYLLEKEKEGNPDAVRICGYLAKYIGIAFRNVIFATDPDLFVIQGVFAHASDSFFEKVKEEIRISKYLKETDIRFRREPRSLAEMLRLGSLNIIISNLL